MQVLTSDERAQYDKLSEDLSLFSRIEERGYDTEKFLRNLQNKKINLAISIGKRLLDNYENEIIKEKQQQKQSWR